MYALVQPFRFAWRRLKRTPTASLLAVVAFGLGIGLTATMFSSVYGVALRGLPFPDSDRLVHIEYAPPPTGWGNVEVSIHDFRTWQEELRSFDQLAAFYDGTVNLADDGFPERYNGAFMTAESFDLLQVRPLHGRAFAAGDDAPGAAPVVILGYSIFRKRYGSDPSVVGRTIRVNGEPATVIGVMEEGFQFPIKQDVWVPLSLDPITLERGEGPTLEVFGRLRRGVASDEAQVELSTLAKRLAAAYPDSNQGLESVLVKPYIREYTPEAIVNVLWTMLGAVGFVLLIACANVAGLLLARASARSQELATRLALGAERRRVIWDLLAEGLMLASGGALLGLAFARWGTTELGRMVDAQPDPPYWVTPGLEPPVLLFMLAATLAAGLLAGLVPALQASRMDVNSLLKDESRGSSGFRIGAFSRFAVVGQIALACILLLGAGLMTRTIVNLRTADLGFATDRVMTARIGLFENAYPEPADRRHFWERLVETLEEAPDAALVATTSSLPTTGMDGTWYRLEGETYAERHDVPGGSLAVVSPAFFEVFDIPVRAGRAFNDADREGAEPVVIVNRSFAERHWPDSNPLGKRLRFGREDREGAEPEPWRTVVGVVADAWMNNLRDENGAGIYAPLAQLDYRFLSVAIKTRGEPAAFTNTLRQAVIGLDPDLPIYWPRTMDEVVAKERFLFDLFGGMFASFGAVALMLAAIGIYGVTAFSVGRRTREIGVRMALGARPGDVLRMILRQGTARLAVGLGIGLAAGLGVSFLLASFLFGVSPTDPLTYATIAVFLAAVTLLACLIPARAAMRVAPVEALRYE